MPNGVRFSVYKPGCSREGVRFAVRKPGCSREGVRFAAHKPGCSGEGVRFAVRKPGKKRRHTIMTSPESLKWMAFLENNLLEDMVVGDQPDLLWCDTALNDQIECSADNESLKKNLDKQDKCCLRKRIWDESSTAIGSKACREKMRRGRLNERFMELSAILDPDKTPKVDKASILADAVQVLNQLKMEAAQLKKSNLELHESIKELKAEKNEIRDEKVKLKAEKERLEQQMKAIVVPSGFIPHPAASFQAALAIQSQAANKGATVPGYPGGIGMWQWMPPSTVDTSQDHLLRPPAA